MEVVDTIDINGKETSICGISSQQNADSEYSIKDEQGNCIANFKDGNFQTKHFNSSVHKMFIQMEKGGFEEQGSFDYTIESFEGMMRNSYIIKTNGAKKLAINSDLVCYVIQFDNSYTKIAIDAVDKNIFALKENCAYIRITKRYTELKPLEIAFYEANSTPTEEKNVQIRDIAERLVFEVSEGVCTTARLMLPPNYTTNGKKVPIIIVDKGDGSFTRWDNEIYQTGSAGPYDNAFNYLRDNGFAVFEIYGWGSYNYQHFSGCGVGTAIAVPTAITAHEKGVEYVTSRFNLDRENIFHICKSGGGKIGLYYAINPSPIRFRSLYSFSPVLDGLNYPSWGAGFDTYRQAMHAEMNFRDAKVMVDGVETSTLELFLANDVKWGITNETGQAFIKANADKFAACCAVNWQGLTGQTMLEKIEDSKVFADGWSADMYAQDIYNRNNLSIIAKGAPMTLIGSPADSSCPYQAMREIINQLLNGGHEAHLITLEKGGHICADFSNEISDVTTHLGIHYDSIAFGWHYVVEDIYARFIKE